TSTGSTSWIAAFCRRSSRNSEEVRWASGRWRPHSAKIGARSKICTSPISSRRDFSSARREAASHPPPPIGIWESRRLPGTDRCFSEDVGRRWWVVGWGLRTYVLRPTTYVLYETRTPHLQPVRGPARSARADVGLDRRDARPEHGARQCPDRRTGPRD